MLELAPEALFFKFQSWEGALIWSGGGTYFIFPPKFRPPNIEIIVLILSQNKL